jgi:hypothetical protein
VSDLEKETKETTGHEVKKDGESGIKEQTLVVREAPASVERGRTAGEDGIISLRPGTAEPLVRSWSLRPNAGEPGSEVKVIGVFSGFGTRLAHAERTKLYNMAA